jgi:hypothetical protein
MSVSTSGCASYFRLWDGRIREAGGTEEWPPAGCGPSGRFRRAITVDQSIPDQQNLSGRTISILILCAPTNRLHELALLAPSANLALASIAAGQVVRIKCGGSD